MGGIFIHIFSLSLIYRTHRDIASPTISHHVNLSVWFSTPIPDPAM
jgi:hypothetical protein